MWNNLCGALANRVLFWDLVDRSDEENYLALQCQLVQNYLYNCDYDLGIQVLREHASLYAWTVVMEMV